MRPRELSKLNRASVLYWERAQTAATWALFTEGIRGTGRPRSLVFLATELVGRRGRWEVGRLESLPLMGELQGGDGSQLLGEFLEGG